jgi:PAS domain-containing protein
MQDPFSLPAIIARSAVMAQSFSRLVGRPLLPSGPGPDHEAFAARLYEAPFVLLSHTSAADPVFCYANRAAQTLFGYGWDEFTTLPSRLSAAPISRQERENLLLQAKERGFIDNYQGIRIGKDGRRFRIEGVILWNLCDELGTYLGQAAVFDTWTAI